MHKVKAMLLAAAVTAGLPAMASAQDQQQGERRDRGNWQRPSGDGQRPDQGNGRRGGDDQQRAQLDQARAQADQARAQADQERAQAEQARAQADQARNQQQQQQARQFDRRPDFNRGDRNNVRPDQGRPPQGTPDWRRGPDARRGDFRPDGGPGRAPGPDPRFDNRRGFDNRPGFAPGGRQDFRPDPRQFNRDWRQDRRFDWRGYRDSHRDAFRAPRYVAPRNWGWGYRPFSIGAVLPGLFFDQQYWISDPWAYRLPPAYGPYRWVRYFNDVLLIDLRSGAVVDSIPNFFW